MDLKLTGKAALVTGAASGIGRAVARLLAGEGVRVMVGDLQEEKGVEVASEIKGRFIRMNTSVKSEVERAVQDTITAFGQIDILCNIAGPGAVGGQLDTTEEEFQRQINGHLKGAFLCTQAVLPHMMERKSGKIVNIGSFAGHGVLDGIPAYCASFGGVLAYTKSVARFAAPYNININSVSPGNILTPMTLNWLNEGNNMESVTNAIPLHRIGTPEDIAAVIVFLASDCARHLVGIDVNVSGGQLI